MAKKRHHYISDFLCKKFSADGKMFFRYDNESKITINASTKDGFVQKHLNRIKRNGEFDNDTIEDIFSKYFEIPASVAISHLINKANLENPPEILLTGKEFVDILRFCVLSHLRTPNKINETYLSILRFHYTMAYSQLHILGESLERNFKINLNRDFIFLQSIKAIDEILEELKDISACVIYHDSIDKFFVLPDQPVAIHSSENREFGSKDLKIIFPISSRVMIIFDKNEKLDVLSKASENQIDNLNLMACNRYYKYITCESKSYLDYFIKTYDPKPEPIQTDKNIEEEIEKIIGEVINNITTNAGISNIVQMSRHEIKIFKLLKDSK